MSDEPVYLKLTAVLSELEPKRYVQGELYEQTSAWPPGPLIPLPREKGKHKAKEVSPEKATKYLMASLLNPNIELSEEQAKALLLALIKALRDSVNEDTDPDIASQRLEALGKINKALDLLP